MRAAVERRMRRRVTTEAAAVSFGDGLVPERKYRRASRLTQVLLDVAMTVAARDGLSCQGLPIRVVEHSMRIARKRLELVGMT